MGVPKWHRSKSRQKQRRMHLHLTKPRLALCGKCGKPVLTHTVCMNCGYYRDRQMIDVLAKLTKKERKKKEKELAAQEASAPSKELNPEELSKSN